MGLPGQFESAMARAILRMSVRDLVRHPGLRSLGGSDAGPSGDLRRRSRAGGKRRNRGQCPCRDAAALWAGPREWLRRSLTRYIAALIEYQRLTLHRGRAFEHARWSGNIE